MKRDTPSESDEEMLFMRTVRDMNLSKLVADDVPLFMNLLDDLFPKAPACFAGFKDLDYGKDLGRSPL